MLERSACTADAPKQMGESARERPLVPELISWVHMQLQLDTYKSEAVKAFRGMDLPESISKTRIELRASLWVKNKKTLY